MRAWANGVAALAMLVGASMSGAEGQAPSAPAPGARLMAQERVRARVARLLQERVGLSDDQMRRLAQITPGIEQSRQALFREERTARQTLRRELSAASPDQNRVAAQIDQLFALQRRRLELAADEQRQLAAFMTPVQRARYLALQEHLRRRADEMRRGRGGGRGGGPARGGRGGPRSGARGSAER
jgi:Spy/CpxP family protein refolding chaperone